MASRSKAVQGRAACAGCKPRLWHACAHLLGDADVKGALREALLKAVHAGAAAHGRVDAHHPAVQLRLGYQRIRKVVRVAAGLQQQTPGSEPLYCYPGVPRETSYDEAAVALL